MRVLVTGGGGFLGSAIVQQLNAKGYEVISFSRGTYPDLENAGVTHFTGDISDYNSLKNAMAGCEGVFHVAAKTGVWGEYKDYYRTNVTGTENILKACKELNIRNLVYTSSPSVVFDGTDSEGHNESLPYPGNYTAWYPKTKAMAEQLVMSANSDSLKTVSLRPHLIWGPGDHYTPKLFEKASRGKLLLLTKSPKLVDCIYVDNAARAHMLAFDQLLKNAAKVQGKTYFISQDEPIALSEFINKLIATGGFPPVNKYLPASIAKLAGRLLERAHVIFKIHSEPAITLFLAQQLSTAHWYNISAAKEDLGYAPEVSLEEGMERLRAWVLKYGNKQDGVQ